MRRVAERRVVFLRDDFLPAALLARRALARGAGLRLAAPFFRRAIVFLRLLRFFVAMVGLYIHALEAVASIRLCASDRHHGAGSR